MKTFDSNDRLCAGQEVWIKGVVSPNSHLPCGSFTWVSVYGNLELHVPLSELAPRQEQETIPPTAANETTHAFNELKKLLEVREEQANELAELYKRVADLHERSIILRDTIAEHCLVIGQNLKGER